MKISHSNKYTIGDIVVTKDGKVGKLLCWEPINTISGPELLFITNISNNESDATGYFKDEIDIIDKEIFKKLNKTFH